MFSCDLCPVLSTRIIRFRPCNHAVCDKCIANLIWRGEDNHCLCCEDPSCKVCGERADVIAETYGGSSHTLYERCTDDNGHTDDNKCHQN